MSEAAKRTKAEWWDGLKAEFKKIVWPDKASLGRQTLAVIIVTIIVGIIIAVVDMGLQYGIDFLVNF